MTVARPNVPPRLLPVAEALVGEARRQSRYVAFIGAEPVTHAVYSQGGALYLGARRHIASLGLGEPFDISTALARGEAPQS